MASYPKYLKLSFRIWWILFFLMQGLLLAMMCSTLGSEKWVYSDSSLYVVDVNQTRLSESEHYFDGSSFKGSLFKCHEGCSDKYDDEKEYWCDLYDEYDKKNLSGKILNTYSSTCRQFTYLSFGSGVYIITEVLSIIGLVAWALVLLCYRFKINCLSMSYCCSGCVWTGHYVAFLVFVDSSNIKFNKNCSTTPTSGERPALCSDDGLNLAFFLLLYIPILTVLYCFVACNLQKLHGTAGFSPVENVSPVFGSSSADSSPGPGPLYRSVPQTEFIHPVFSPDSKNLGKSNNVADSNQEVEPRILAD